MIVRSGYIGARCGHKVQVDVDRPASCAACSAGRGCGLMNVIRLFGISGRHSLDISLRTGQACQVGDAVTLSIPESRLLKMSVLAYLVPVLCLGTGAWCGSLLVFGAGELGSILGGGAGLIIACSFQAMFEWRLRGRPDSGLCDLEVLPRPVTAAGRDDCPQES